MQIMTVLNRAEEHALFDIGASWFPNGKGFSIHDKKKFAEIALQKYFNNIRFSSFTRQMRRWGFKALQGFQRNTASYYHPMFNRGDLQSCKRMRPLGQRPLKADISILPQKGGRSKEAMVVSKNKIDKRESRTSAAFDLLALSGAAAAEESLVQHQQDMMPSLIPQESFHLQETRNLVDYTTISRAALLEQERDRNVLLQEAAQAAFRNAHLHYSNVRNVFLSRSAALTGQSALNRGYPYYEDNFNPVVHPFMYEVVPERTPTALHPFSFSI